MQFGALPYFILCNWSYLQNQRLSPPVYDLPADTIKNQSKD